MTGKQILKSVTAIGLSLSLVFSISAGNVRAKADEPSQSKASLQQQEQQLDDQIAKMKNDKSKQQQYQDALNAKMGNLEEQIDSKNREISELDSDIIQKQKDIAGKEKEINKDYQELKQRVYALYLTGEASELDIVLNAKSIMDFADKAEMLDVISKHDTALINSVKKDLSSVKTQKEQIEKNRKKVTDDKTSLEQNQKQMNVLAQEAEQAYNSMDQSEKDAESKLAANQAAQQRAAAATAAADANQSTGGNGSGSNTSGSTGNSVNSGNRTSQSSSAQGSGNNSGNNSSNNSGGNSSSSGNENSGSSSDIVAVAEQYIGTPYSWGGAARGGFDCSGFVSYVLYKSGHSVGRLTVTGLTGITTPVSSPRAGDLVYYDDYGHVGIYMGGGRAIQCDGDKGQPRPGVEIVNLSNYWGSHVDSYGRLNY